VPKIVLNDRAQEVKVPLGLLVLRAFLNPPMAGVQVTATTRDGVPVPTPAVPPPPGTTVLGADQVDGVVVRVSSAKGFPPGSIITVVAETGVYSVEIGPIMTAGLLTQDVATLKVQMGQLVVRAIAGDRENEMLTPLGEAARAATTELLGVSRVGDSERFGTAIVIDGSASMRLAVGGKRLTSLLDILSGVFAVSAERGRVAVAVSGAAPRLAQAEELANLRVIAHDQFEQADLSSGAHLADRSLYAGDPTMNTIFWVLTDDVPSDMGELVVTNETPGKAVHVVVVGDSSMAPPSEVAGVPISFVDAEILQDEGDAPRNLSLPAIVRSLLRGCFAAGTSAYGKVQR
jgi:hypothetical protein